MFIVYRGSKLKITDVITTLANKCSGTYENDI